MPNCKRALVTVLLVVFCGFAAFALDKTSQNRRSSAGDKQQYFAVSPAISAPGQFVQFSWKTNQADSFSVRPSLLGEDEVTLPPSASRYLQVAPAESTVFRGIGAASGTPMSAALTIVPVTVTSSAISVAAGQAVQLSFSGPNNGSSYFLTVLPENTTIPLSPDSCRGTVCRGTYLSGPLGNSKVFMVGATGPYQGQAYSARLPVQVAGGMTLGCTATPAAPLPGQAVTLAWRSSHAVALHIDQGVGEVASAGAGSIVVHPTQTTTYTCTATDRFGNRLSSPAKVTLSSGDVSNLNHIIFMLQENRAFDNYFGQLAYYRVNIDHIPGAQMSDVNDLHDLPSGYTIPNPQGQNFAPFHQRSDCIEGLNPNWNETHQDMDVLGGNWLNLSSSSQFAMDKFLFTTGYAQYDPTETRPLGYYDWTDLPFYYELATQFATSDTFYSPVPAATTINRMYLFAGTSYGDIFAPGDTNWTWTRPTIFRKLTNAGISWRYYYQDNSVFLAKWDDWNDPQIQGNVRNIQEWYNILASPTADQDLPQVVFIERASATGYDEHPGNNMQKGAARVQQLMTPLLTSNAWPDSAFILSFDEGGGTYDHQPPTLATPPDDKVPMPYQSQPFIHGMFNVTGFRVPVMLVSPWSKPHDVWHMPGDYTSILKLIETRYNMNPLTHRDRDAADLTDPVNGPFDFSSPQMLTVPPLPTQPTDGTCNYQLEGSPD